LTKIKQYTEGLHILVKAEECDIIALQSMEEFVEMLELLISKLQLTKTGIIPHKFPNNAFTIIIGLTESHLSIHTWPEYGIANYDIYLSNQEQINDNKVYELDKAIIHFLKSKKVTKTEKRR